MALPTLKTTQVQSGFSFKSQVKVKESFAKYACLNFRIPTDVRPGIHPPVRIHPRLQPHRRALQPQRRPRGGGFLPRPDPDRPEDGHLGLDRHGAVGGRGRADADHQRGQFLSLWVFLRLAAAL